MNVQVRRADRDFVALPLAEAGGEVRAVVWPGTPARHRSMHYIVLPSGGRTVPHRHADAEAVYYVIKGDGAIEDLDAGSAHPVRAGSVVWVTPGSQYRIVAAPHGGLTCVGGPCPPDAALYSGVRRA